MEGGKANQEGARTSVCHVTQYAGPLRRRDCSETLMCAILGWPQTCQVQYNRLVCLLGPQLCQVYLFFWYDDLLKVWSASPCGVLLSTLRAK
jgi:hypothetical protein